MLDWIKENGNLFIAPLVGILGTMLGIWISSQIENKRRKKESVDKAKPIIINHFDDSPIRSSSATIVFESVGECSRTITGVFKNIDNGILHLDYIETERKKYYPSNCSTVDKNTVFYIELKNITGETCKRCDIYCHDIFGNMYLYRAQFSFNVDGKSEIVIQDSIPLPKGKKKSKTK